MSASLHLPARLDNSAASDLLEAFQRHQGQPLLVDGSAVTHLGSLSAQVIVSAVQSWASDGKTLEFIDGSDALYRAWSDLGLTHFDLPGSKGKD